MEVLRFFQRLAHKHVVIQIAARFNLAFNPDGGTGQGLTEQVLCRRAGYMAGIHADIGLMAGAVLPGQVIAPIPAALGRQGEFAVKTAHAVASANGDFVLRSKRGFIPLGMQIAVVAKRLLAQLERQVQTGIGTDNLHAAAAFVKQLFRRGQALIAPGAAFVTGTQIKGGVAQVFFVIHIHRPAAGAAALGGNFDVIDVVLRFALPQLGTNLGFTAGIAVKQAADAEIAVPALAVVVVVFT